MGTACAAGLVGDALCVLAILQGAFFWAHKSAPDSVLSPVFAWLYSALGITIFTASFAYVGIYSRELLLDRRKQTMHLLEAWLAASILFFGPVSVFGAMLLPLRWGMLAALALLPLLLSWRFLLQSIMRSDAVTQRLRQRIIILGWSAGAAQLTRQSWEIFAYPCEIIGYVEIENAADDTTPTVPFLGSKENLPNILHEHQVDVAFLAGTDFPAADILELAQLCQKEMAEFKIIPSYFPPLASGMHIEWVSGVPILGTDRLRINRLHVRMQKRALDIVGALVGLVLTAPLIGIFSLLVYLESPGRIFYRQRRLGRKGQPLDMIKIRSMRLDAEKDGRPGWTVSDDPRRLKIGAFMRRWNIDELPQFWNVLKGEMSLVGPRPERPEFIANLKHEIVHYNLRHSVKPGLTGWAQVNGLRGDTDLSERIRLDLFYIDNWSLLLDLQTLFLTLFKHKNAC